MNKQVQAIREEIVRQKEYSRTMSDNAINGYMRNFFDGADDMCNQLLNFIDSLPDEQCDEDLEEAADEYIAPIENDAGLEFINFSGKDIKDAFVAGAKWQKELFERNRLSNCDTLTKEEYDRETAFAMEIIEKEHRKPTFTDAINYGMRLQKKQMMKSPLVSNGQTASEQLQLLNYQRGRNDMYKQMMKEAVEYKIVNNLAAYPVIYYDVNHLGLKYGDKIKLIILKDDENTRTDN